MRSSVRSLGVVAGISTGLLFLACVPIFTDGLFQTLSFSFKFDKKVAAGEQKLVHLTVFPDDVKIKKSFVQVSGRLTGNQLPDSATLLAEVANPDPGRVVQKVSLELNVGEDGRFSANAKVKKNVKAGEILSVTLEPRGADLTKTTEITLCVDLVRKKTDLAAVPECVPEDDPGGDDPPPATFSSLQADHLTPTCARGGCHSAASSAGGLSLEGAAAYGNLVNAPSQQQPGLNRVTPNDPENSYLIQKLRGDLGISGSRMPQGGPFLSDEQIERFVSWIDNGAPND